MQPPGQVHRLTKTTSPAAVRTHSEIVRSQVNKRRIRTKKDNGQRHGKHGALIQHTANTKSEQHSVPVSGLQRRLDPRTRGRQLPPPLRPPPPYILNPHDTVISLSSSLSSPPSLPSISRHRIPNRPIDPSRHGSGFGFRRHGSLLCHCRPSMALHLLSYVITVLLPSFLFL